jgi:hypothetical protein
MTKVMSHINSKNQIRRSNKLKLVKLKISLKRGSQTSLKYRMVKETIKSLLVKKCICLTVLAILTHLVSIELLVTDFSTTKFSPKFRMSNFLLSLRTMICEKVQIMSKIHLRNFLVVFPISKIKMSKRKYLKLPVWW